MNQPTKPFKLHTSVLSPDAPVTPAEASPFAAEASPSAAEASPFGVGDLPAEVAGQPATYLWKDMIHTGAYVHPKRKFSLAVDRDRLGRWADAGQKMLAAGVAIPINCDHSDAARDVVGYVKGFKLDDDRLLGLCQFIGDDAALTAARNLVSVGIDPDFTDGQARQWGEAIVHLALTPVPVVPDQDQFVEATAEGEASAAEGEASANDEESPELVLVAESSDQNAEGKASATEGEASAGDQSELVLPCTADQLQTLRSLIGDDFDAESGVARIIQWLQSPNQNDSTEDRSEELQAELSSAREQILQLSARLPPVMPQEVQAALVESATAKFDAAVLRGSLSPAARDRLVATLVQSSEGRANVIALSRTANAGGDRSLALAVGEILLDNSPIELGERTGLQAMARHVPGEDSSPIEQLRQYMTKIASVSG
ncbi:MAG: hypothetical protein ABSB74_06745 [Tepidisphaeraceae bacterium]